MRLYLWKDVDHVTDREHHRGGLVVVAENLGQARALAYAVCGSTCGSESKDPDCTWELDGNYVQSIHVLPNAGCC